METTSCFVPFTFFPALLPCKIESSLGDIGYGSWGAGLFLPRTELAWTGAQKVSFEPHRVSRISPMNWGISSSELSRITRIEQPSSERSKKDGSGTVSSTDRWFFRHAQPYPGLSLQFLLVRVHGLRRSELIAVGLHELVSHDNHSPKTGCSALCLKFALPAQKEEDVQGWGEALTPSVRANL